MKTMTYTRLDNQYAIRNVRVATPRELLDNQTIIIKDGRIEAIKPENRFNRLDMPVFNGQNYLTIPGLIDLHGDSLERAVAPRSSAPFPVKQAVSSYIRELATHGITTMYHCVAMADVGDTTKPLRDHSSVMQMIRALKELDDKNTIHNRIHLRYEISDVDALPAIEKLVEEKEIDLLSLMDHAPGYGVFGSVESYRDYFIRSGLSRDNASSHADQMLKLRAKVDEAAIKRLIGVCRQKGIPVASHDDHTAEKVQQSYDMGITISEFPINGEAIDKARTLGMSTVFGAANIIRGGSHAGSVSAIDVIKDRNADIICSDYAPMSLIPSIFMAYRASKLPLFSIIKMYTANPAKVLGIFNETGSLEPGKNADMVIINPSGDIPQVLCSIREGRILYLRHDLFE
jgi:alpha-D-ribose 1-methylphosphonate 5-triphosphate diphosphatase